MNTTSTLNRWKLADARSNQESNPLHHLWLNRGVWWIHITITNGITTQRLRYSLKTRDEDTALRRRTNIFNALQNETFSL